MPSTPSWLRKAMDVAAGSKDKQSSQTSGASGSVCAACKAIRSKCDRNRPCARCIYRGKADECVREVASGQCTSADDVLVVALDKVLSARADCRGELAGGKRKRTGARTLQEVLRDAAAAVREARNRASASRTTTDACNAPAACSPSISECFASASLREALLASRGLLCVELHTDEEGHDHDARVVALGRGAQEFFGDTPWGDLRGQAMKYLVHPADQSPFQCMCERAAAAAAMGGDVHAREWGTGEGRDQVRARLRLVRFDQTLFVWGDHASGSSTDETFPSCEHVLIDCVLVATAAPATSGGPCWPYAFLLVGDLGEFAARRTQKSGALAGVCTKSGVQAMHMMRAVSGVFSRDSSWGFGRSNVPLGFGLQRSVPFLSQWIRRTEIPHTAIAEDIRGLHGWLSRLYSLGHVLTQSVSQTVVSGFMQFLRVHLQLSIDNCGKPFLAVHIGLSGTLFGKSFATPWRLIMKQVLAGKPVPYGNLQVAGLPLHVVPVVQLGAENEDSGVVLFHCTPTDAFAQSPPEPGSSAAGLLCFAQVSCGCEHENLCLCWRGRHMHARTHTHARGGTHTCICTNMLDVTTTCCVAQTVWTIHARTHTHARGGTHTCICTNMLDVTTTC